MDNPEVSYILAPVDFLDMTGPVVEQAAFLSRQFGASLILLHVVHMPSLAEAGAWLEPVIAPGIEQEMKKQMRVAAEAKLKELAEHCSEAGIDVSIEVRDGSPFEEIIELAGERGVDLIVMGSQGRTGLSHFLVGSVAERVVRRARCNVLCIKPGMESGKQGL